MKNFLFVLMLAMMTPQPASIGQAYDSSHKYREREEEVTEKMRQLKHMIIEDAVTDDLLRYKQQQIDSFQER